MKLTLRPFEDGDTELFTKWLYMPHVAKWYKYPLSWQNEINGRNGEYSWIHHFIVEADGAPVGFCQYYDCFDNREPKAWDETGECDYERTEVQGALFGIDYLIGETDCLRRGYGTEIVRLLIEKLTALGAKSVIAQPEGENAASVKVLEANDFMWNSDCFEKNLARVILETPRLILREMTQLDLAALAEIIQDGQTMRAYEGAMSDDETAQWLLRQLTRYEENGFGLWAVVLKETGKMIGQCGLSWQDADGERVLEIGYLFNRAHWHNGYAAEAAVGCKNYAFDVLEASEVYSIIRSTNCASMNVAIKNEMTVKGEFVKHYRGVDMPHLIFSVKRTKQSGR